jgi:hypothetical protein
MPVRKVSNRGKNIIGGLPSIKLSRMVAFESLIERDLIYLLEFEQEVAWYAEQPFTIPYQHHGKALAYTPDFHILRGGQNVVAECKPAKFANTDENLVKFEAASAWCAEGAAQAGGRAGCLRQPPLPVPARGCEAAAPGEPPDRAADGQAAWSQPIAVEGVDQEGQGQAGEWPGSGWKQTLFVPGH